jgi:hypothetical protein
LPQVGGNFSPGSICYIGERPPGVGEHLQQQPGSNFQISCLMGFLTLEVKSREVGPRIKNTTILYHNHFPPSK